MAIFLSVNGLSCLTLLYMVSVTYSTYSCNEYTGLHQENVISLVLKHLGNIQMLKTHF
jgi:hypothetical protein